MEVGNVSFAKSFACILSRSSLFVRSSRWWLSSLGVFALALTLLCPPVALADSAPSIEINGNPTGLTENDRGYIIVNCGNQFDAALTLIGKFQTKIQIDNNMYVKLSNAETGGRFYELAQSFSKWGSNGSDYSNYEGWAGDTNYQMLLVDVYGFGRVWGTETNSRKIAAAREDYMTVLSGGSLGGGESEEGYYEIGNFIFGSYISSSSPIKKLTKIRLDKSYFSDIAKSALDTSNGAIIRFDLVAGESTGNFEHVYIVSGQGDITVTPTDTRKTISGTAGSSRLRTDWGYVNGVYEYSDDGHTLTITNTSYGPYGNASQSMTSNWSNYYSIDSTTAARKNFVGELLSAGGGGGGGGGGGNNWPEDEPTPTPTPPEVPSPPENPTVDPDPWPNPPSNPIYDPDPIPTPPNEPYVVVQEPSNTTSQDYTPWLAAILQALNGLGTALANHCVHLQTALADYLEWLNTEIGRQVNNQRLSIQSYLKLLFERLESGIDVSIDDGITELEGYLQDLFAWLAAELDFSVSGGDYDDSTVVSWLKKIYLELVSMGGSPGKQQLTTIDYDSSLGRLSNAYGALSDNLPFCIPDDMQTCLSWFITSPVTPVFDAPWGFAGGSASVRVDLHGWDGVAAACRNMFFALFCLELCKYTLHLWRLYRAAFVGVSI